jgi:hypothetical protein
VSGTRLIQLTTRDFGILREVARYRFLDSAQIQVLVGGSAQHLLKRLQRLFHGGYLDRPRAQLRYFSEEGSRPIVYALGRKGAKALESPRNRRSRYDNRTLKQQYMQHTLLVADVMIAFTRACRAEGAPKLLLEEDLFPNETPGVVFRWGVTVSHEGSRKRVGVVPDRAFALESTSTGERIIFFVEADRATMPVERKSLAQTSMLRKLLAYEATWAQGIHLDRFHCERFRVLVVTSSPERARHLAQVCEELPRGRGLFLFIDADTLRGKVVPTTDGNVLELPWLNATGGTERLADTFALKDVA